MHARMHVFMCLFIAHHVPNAGSRPGGKTKRLIFPPVRGESSCLTALSWDVGLFPAFRLKRKRQLFLGLQAAGFQTGTYTISSPGFPACRLQIWGLVIATTTPVPRPLPENGVSTVSPNQAPPGSNLPGSGRARVSEAGPAALIHFGNHWCWPPDVPNSYVSATQSRCPPLG